MFVSCGRKSGVWLSGTGNKPGGVSAISTSLPDWVAVLSGKKDLLLLEFSRILTSFGL